MNSYISPLADCASSRTQPLPTLTMTATTSPMKKTLPQTCQMAMKTEDSLVFSWEGRHIPIHFVLDICFRHFISHLWFSFWDLHPFEVHTLSLQSISLYSSKHFHGATFLLCVIPSQMPWSRGFVTMMNHSEPFLFHFKFYVLPQFMMILSSHSYDFSAYNVTFGLAIYFNTVQLYIIWRQREPHG